MVNMFGLLSILGGVWGLRLTSTHFGIFVIFAAIYAAGTLGIGRPEIGGVVVKVGEIFSPLVALFGMASVIGLVFGQFVANSASPLGPMDMASPVVSFAGLLAIWYLRRRMVVAGVLAYVVITSLWLAFLLSLNMRMGYGEALGPAFLSQLAAVVIGYAIYKVLRRVGPFKERRAEAVQVS